MGLSSNILWHQTTLKGLLGILKSKSFICSYSLETIKWRNSELKVAFPMVSFCDLPISDMKEYLTNNDSQLLEGKYGICTIGLNMDWAQRNGLCHIWYHDIKSSFLRTYLPGKSELLKSLKSTRYPNRWLLMTRIKPYTGPLDSKGFKDYRFYDEREIRYIPNPRQLVELNINRTLTEDEYKQYKESRRFVSDNKSEGDGLIPNLIISFNPNDIRYILYVDEKERKLIEKCVEEWKHDIIFLSYTRIVEEIIGTNHSRRI